MARRRFRRVIKKRFNKRRYGRKVKRTIRRKSRRTYINRGLGPNTSVVVPFRSSTSMTLGTTSGAAVSILDCGMNNLQDIPEWLVVFNYYRDLFNYYRVKKIIYTLSSGTCNYMSTLGSVITRLFTAYDAKADHRMVKSPFYVKQFPNVKFHVLTAGKMVRMSLRPKFKSLLVDSKSVVRIVDGTNPWRICTQIIAPKDNSFNAIHLGAEGTGDGTIKIDVTFVVEFRGCFNAIQYQPQPP